jgi:hypothetical protein
MTHRDLTRRMTFDVLLAAAVIIFYVAAGRALALLAPHLPGGAGLWAAIAVGCMVGVAICGWAICRAAAQVDDLLAEAAERRSVIDAIETVGDMADVVSFDFPREGPRLVLIRGGRDVGEGAA